MKRLIMLVGAILVSSHTIAGSAPLSSFQHTLGKALKTPQTVQPVQIQNDLAMVYGGADISRQPTLAFNTATA